MATMTDPAESKLAEEKDPSPEIHEEDDWQLPFDFNLFAQYESRSIYLTQSKKYEIECVEALSPLDMMSLSTGVHDATGFCVWTGAFLLLSCLDEMKEYFCQKRVIELGCGTGICVGLLQSPASAPSYICFTDADPDALELCRRNCERNIGEPSDSYTIDTLVWGEALPPSVQAESFDTVLAADILYDIGMLPAVLKSTKECLKHGGYFVLAHVPRACFNSDNPPVDNLEEYIVQQAESSSLELVSTLRPRDMPERASLPADALNSISLREMDEIGSAILIFRCR